MYPYTYEMCKDKKTAVNNIADYPRVAGAKAHDFMEIKNRDKIKIVFESVNSDWDQGNLAHQSSGHKIFIVTNIFTI